MPASGAPSQFTRLYLHCPAGLSDPVRDALTHMIHRAPLFTCSAHCKPSPPALVRGLSPCLRLGPQRAATAVNLGPPRRAVRAGQDYVRLSARGGGGEVPTLCNLSQLNPSRGITVSLVFCLQYSTSIFQSIPPGVEPTQTPFQILRRYHPVSYVPYNLPFHLESDEINFYLPTDAMHKVRRRSYFIPSSGASARVTLERKTINH